MNRLTAVTLGVVAWAGVAAIAVLSVNAWSDDNQVLAFIPIIGAVVVAWAAGEFLTEQMFDQEEE